ncbi:hypothetical protein HK099_004158 [Clydaea vesicula]|uniref:DUF2855 family protein n=1 Tax=Clydaea vesicula TaxID=447962 RepID=A0AAD5XVS1_9FUNG|nr:hypothetical protein HK099_004158 [Clydaea vesicula]
MPVWGFGTVLKTKNASITLNERIFGYFPASKYIILCPVKVNYSNFMVSRPQVPVDRVVYNTYVRVKNNLAFQKNEEGISIFWPLWATAYNLVYMLNANKNWFAKNIIVTSASSKTSFCFAKEFGRRNNGTRLIGLTSKANVDFVKSLKLYDVVLTYDNYKNLETDMKSLIVDVAGDRLLNSNLAKHLGDNRVQTVTVGMSHYEPNEKSLDARPAEETSRNRTSLFFAPVWILKRRDELGKEKAQELEEIAWNDTVQHLHNWIKFSKFKGPLTTEIVYQKAIAGKLDAKVGYIVSML